MTSRKVRYGLIGAGNNAVKKHLSNYSRLSNIELVAVCDVNIENGRKAAETYNIPNVYKNYQDMIIKEDLDIVSVCTPNSLHTDITIYALQNGVNVHCEKPLAINGKEAQRIVEAKNRSGKNVMVGLNNRFTNEAVYLKKCIDEGYLGDIYKAKAGWIRRSGIPGRGTWFTNKEVAGGGVMIDLGVHYLDLALYLMGMPEPTYVTGATYQNFAHTDKRNRNGYKGNPNGIFNVEDSANGFIGLQDGATVNFEFSWASNIDEDQTFIEILGTKGGASIINGELKIHSEILDSCVDISPILNPNIKLKNEFEHFTNSILSSEELLAPAEHGVYMMNIIDHFYLSAEKQEPVFFEKNNNCYKRLSSIC
ncbi:Gfo/Idh/MocA family oxidoreductase [Metabacillus halosaccharovorans]|uniref:Gfo/Idh/MocA family protein n=1 Tax=Metabacillus halosaccharovorans TaxID=930124 RepID=UPI00203F16DF|nr:Gfo/Idh/MocA family oxidoreductase [Metabacillus halosaccharovorans]MCM3440245.1 Gfo/Idh/MocA family oxidoreductase [Metabacillus halosaccharovorans]